MIIKKRKSDSENQHNTEFQQGDTGSAQKQSDKDKIELDFENLDFAQRNETRRGNKTSVTV